jgi:hypothetical protein
MPGTDSQVCNRIPTYNLEVVLFYSVLEGAPAETRNLPKISHFSKVRSRLSTAVRLPKRQVRENVWTVGATVAVIVAPGSEVLSHRRISDSYWRASNKKQELTGCTMYMV